MASHENFRDKNMDFTLGVRVEVSNENLYSMIEFFNFREGWQILNTGLSPYAVLEYWQIKNAKGVMGLGKKPVMGGLVSCVIKTLDNYISSQSTVDMSEHSLYCHINHL